MADDGINVMNAILSSSVMTFVLQYIFKKQVADIAIRQADQLVSELQNGRH